MLDDNTISDKGLASLAEAFARGALPVLRKLALDDNYITGDGLTLTLTLTPNPNAHPHPKSHPHPHPNPNQVTAWPASPPP